MDVAEEGVCSVEAAKDESDITSPKKRKDTGRVKIPKIKRRKTMENPQSGSKDEGGNNDEEEGNNWWVVHSLCITSEQGH